MSDTQQSLSARLGVARSKLQWSRAKVAEFLKVPAEDVKQWESGSSPPPSDLVQLLELAAAFDFNKKSPADARTVMDLMLRSAPPPSPSPASSAPPAKQTSAQQLGAKVALLLVLAAMIGGLIQLISWTATFIKSLGQAAVDWPIVRLGVPAALITAFCLFVFRLRCRFIYGLSEIAVGTYIAYRQLPSFAWNHAPDNFEASGLAIALLSGAIYLMVRGMDNCHQGIGTDAVLRILRRSKKGNKLVQGLGDPSGKPPGTV